MKQVLKWILFGSLVSLAMGCSSVTGTQSATVDAANYTSRVIRATGYSRFNDDASLTVNQRWLLAQQAARLDAYRDLAEQLYKEPLDDMKTIGSQVMSDEAYRLYLDTYLRDARTVDYRTLNDALRANLELTLTARFYRCISADTQRVNQCLQEDNKMALTRLGNKTAATKKVNLSCGVGDCGDQFVVQGFSKERNAVDNVLLNAGLNDAEWAAHTGLSLFGRLFFFQELIHGF